MTLSTHTTWKFRNLCMIRYPVWPPWKCTEQPTNLCFIQPGAFLELAISDLNSANTLKHFDPKCIKPAEMYIDFWISIFFTSYFWKEANCLWITKKMFFVHFELKYFAVQKILSKSCFCECFIYCFIIDLDKGFDRHKLAKSD